MAQVHTLDSPSVQVQKKGQKVGLLLSQKHGWPEPFFHMYAIYFFPQDFPFYWKGTCVFNHHRKNAKQEVLSTMRAGCHGLHVLWQLCHLLVSVAHLTFMTKKRQQPLRWWGQAEPESIPTYDIYIYVYIYMYIYMYNHSDCSMPFSKIPFSCFSL